MNQHLSSSVAWAVACVFAVATACEAAEPVVIRTTPDQAVQAVRELRKKNGGKLPGPVTIELPGGVYELKKPIVLTPQDSGTRETPIVWTVKKGERVVLSGGSKLMGWTETELNGKKVWTTKGPGNVFRSLWVGDVRQTRARHPNGFDHLSVPVAPEPDARWEDGQMQFNYKDGEVPDFTFNDAEVLVFNRWVDSRLPVFKNDVALKELRFTRRTVFKTEAGDLFRIENAPEFLDQPGEWYFRRATNEVFYLPKPDEKRETFEAVVPRIVQLLRLEGKPELKQFVEHVSFRDITFAHTEWTIPANGTDPNVDGRPQRGGFIQAAYGVPGVVGAEGARNISFIGCTLTHVGSYGIDFGKGCQDNLVERCTLTDLGAGGIKIGDKEDREPEAEKTARNTIVNCTIADYGKLFASGTGVFIARSFGNRVAHTEIRDGFYTAISVGWRWGYDANPNTHSNVIENNHVHHIGKLSTGEGPLLSDMGGLYTLGIQPGTTIRLNRFHDIDGRIYGGWGIYFDEGTSQVLAEKNLVYNTVHGGFHQHYGRDNVVRNNIFAFARTRQVERSRSEDHTSFTFERNIVLWNQGHGIVGNWDNYNATFRNNQYWYYGEAVPQFAYQSFDEWHNKGMDKGSVVADPGFVDAEKGDFRFKPDRGPAKGIGFETWDLGDVGPHQGN